MELSLLKPNTPFIKKIELNFDQGDFQVKTIDTIQELVQVFELRKICFPKGSHSPAIYEYLSDHLVVTEKTTGRIVGSYRVSLQSQTRHFDTEDDFDIQRMLLQKGEKLELAWACVHPDFRKHNIVQHLWLGVRKIIELHDVKFIFGETSIFDVTQEDLISLKEFFSEKSKLITSDEFYPIRRSPETGTQMQSEPKARFRVPSILKIYLVLGALICSQPSYDSDNDCFDYLTVFDVANLDTK